jgi:hypothetical protein
MIHQCNRMLKYYKQHRQEADASLSISFTVGFLGPLLTAYSNRKLNMYQTNVHCTGFTILQHVDPRRER